MVGERPTEWHAVSGEGPEEAVTHRFHLHVVPQHPLPVVAVIRGRGQKTQQHLISESNALIAALRQVCREAWNSTRQTVEGIIEDAHCSIAEYRHRRDGGFYLTGHEVFWSHSDAAHAVVLDPANGEAIVAGASVATAVNVINVTVVWIYRGVVDAAEQSVHSAKLGSWLSAIAVAYDDSTARPVQNPCGATVSGSVKHEVDVLRVASAVAYASLKETINEAVPRIDSKPVTRVDAAWGCSRLVIYCEVGRADAVGNRNPHIGPATKVVVGGVHVVLRCSRWVPVNQKPGLIGVSEARWDKVIGHL